MAAFAFLIEGWMWDQMGSRRAKHSCCITNLSNVSMRAFVLRAGKLRTRKILHHANLTMLAFTPCT